jgi:DNA end-binding protein Ku
MKAYPAAITSEGDIRLNQLHKDCGSRIKYQKTCPIHGEVPPDSIVLGYEHAKDQYVTLDDEEIDKARSEADKAIKVDKFVKPDTLDPIYQDEKSYYLLPEGPVAQQPYAVVQTAMEQDGVCAVATVVMHGHDQVVLIRPVGRLLLMTMLKHDSEVRKSAEIEELVPAIPVGDKEVEMARTLMRAESVEKLDYSQFRDPHRDKLLALIQAKVAGHEIVAPPQVAAETHVINLMDALRKSVEAAKPAEAEKPKRRWPARSRNRPARRNKPNGPGLAVRYPGDRWHVERLVRAGRACAPPQPPNG